MWRNTEATKKASGLALLAFLLGLGHILQCLELRVRSNPWWGSGDPVMSGIEC